MNIKAASQAASAAIFILLALFVVLRLATTPAPIYALDEYAYLKLGRDVGRVAIESQMERDPHLQRLSNHVYFWLVRLAGRISGDPTSAIRVLNFACFFVVIPLMGNWLLRRHSENGANILFLGLLPLLPASVYVLSPMPEIVFATGYTVIAVVTAVMISRAPFLTSLFSGVALGILAYVKPHAVAAILGFAAFFSVHTIVNWKTGGWHRRLLPFAFAAGLGLGFLSVNAAILGEITIAPRFVGDVYASAVQSAVSPAHFPGSTLTLARYAGLHALALIVLFPLAFAASINAALGAIHRREKTAWNSLDHLALLTALCAAALIAMVCHFTQNAGIIDENESNRMHGRYLFVIFPSLLMLTCHTLSVLQMKTETPLARCVRNRWVIAVFALTAIGAVFLLNRVRLFPWDYPELFSLYSNAAGYWTWDGPAGLRRTVLAGGGILLIACLIRPRHTPWFLGAGQAAWFAASFFSVTFWQEAHARRVEPLAAAGRILRTEVGPNAEDLLFVVSERHSDVSYVLCGLEANPWVRTIPMDAEITPQDIPPGVRTVATMGQYDVKFPFVSYTERGPLKIYLLDASATHTYSVPAPMWDGKEFLTRWDGDHPNSILFGFNKPESFGAWTARDKAVILLPCQVHGRCNLKFRSWAAQKGGGDAVLTIGKSSLSFHVTEAASDFDLAVSIEYPASSIVIHFPPPARLNPWDRRLGIALSPILIAPAAKGAFIEGQ